VLFCNNWNTLAFKVRIPNDFYRDFPLLKTGIYDAFLWDFCLTKHTGRCAAIAQLRVCEMPLRWRKRRSVSLRKPAAPLYDIWVKIIFADL
jgi:hypothetical protein